MTGTDVVKQLEQAGQSNLAAVVSQILGAYKEKAGEDWAPAPPPESEPVPESEPAPTPPATPEVQPKE